MASNPIDSAIEIVAGAFPGIAFQPEHFTSWRLGVTDEMRRLGRIDWPRWPEVVTTAARRYSQRSNVPRPRLAEFLAEIREVYGEVLGRERNANRVGPERQIAPDEKPVDVATIREGRRRLFGWSRDRSATTEIDLDARRREVLRRFREHEQKRSSDGQR